MISTTLLKSLRQRTGAGMIDCKKALEMTEGDIDVAYEFLRLKSQAFSRKKRTEEGILTPWENEDYLKEAYRTVKER